MKTFANPLRLLAAAAVLLFVCLCVVAFSSSPIDAMFWSAAALGTGFLLKDAALKGTRALPAAASATVDGGALDLGHEANGDFLANCEVLVSAPAVNATMAPDTRTFTYSVIMSDASNLGTPTVIHSAIITQTGAGGAGAAAATARVRLPVDVKRYIGLRIVSGASTGDASSVSGTIELVF